MLIRQMILLLALFQSVVEAPIMVREPAISPDGRRIAFVASGDVYIVSAVGGKAHRIVDDPVHALHPRFSPDGRRIAFTSLRSGNGDVYVVDLDTQEQHRITYHSSKDAVESWDPAGQLIYFSSARADIGGYPDIFAVPVDGGTPYAVSRARYEGEYNASASPDGSRLAFNSNDRVRQWYRMGPRTDDATEVWVKPTNPANHEFTRVTTYDGKDSWPMWAPAGDGVYIVTDEYSSNGAENIAFQGLDGPRRPVTAFDRGRVSWPTIASNGTIVFERDFAIWVVRDGDVARQLEIAISDDDIDIERKRTETFSSVSEFHAGAGGSLIAVIHGDIFLRMRDTGAIRRITSTPEPEKDARLSPDGTRVAYTALRDGFFDVYVIDLRDERETRLTSSDETERHLRFSPDGTRLAFVEGADRIKLADLDALNVVDVANGLMMEPQIAWSPDGSMIAYTTSDENWLSNVWVTQVDSPHLRAQLTDFPDVYFKGLTWPWNADALFVSTWTTRETRQVARIHLQEWLSDPGEERWGHGGAQPIVDYILPANESLVLETVDSSRTTALLSGSSLGRSGLWRASFDRGALRNFTFVGPGRIATAELLSDGSAVYLSEGTLHLQAVGEDQANQIDLSAAFEVTPLVKRLNLFRQAWLVFRDWFGDDAFNGLDWEAAYTRYEPWVRGTRNDFDFMTAVRLMLGELNASHINVWGDPDLDDESTGDLGVDFDPAALRLGQLVVSAVVSGVQDPLLEIGDVIDSIDGVKLGDHVNLHEVLAGRSGDTVAVAVRRRGSLLDVSLPVRSTSDVAEGRYRDWVAGNQKIVDELSGGRYSYVHRRHFGAGATEDLRRQLGASALLKDGIVLDARYNGGGIESTRAIGFFRRDVRHINAFKDKVSAPGALVHGIPLLDQPVVLVQNEQMLSDSESFAHQFRTLGVGPVVGTRTAAWNKGQRGYSLFDGTRVSVGAWRALTDDGEDMERAGRPPDIFVDRSLQETLEGRDSQLEAAVVALDRWIAAQGGRR